MKNCFRKIKKLKGPFRETRRKRPKSAPYLRLKNIQGTTIGNIWKKHFFQKKYFLKVTQCRKTQRPFRLIKRFYKQ